jgi:hypothetical protein
VHSALGFWKELLQKDFNSSTLQQRGMEISRCYHQVQEATKTIQSIFADDIKFAFRLGKFLINVINNEFEGRANFKRAFALYQNKI